MTTKDKIFFGAAVVVVAIVAVFSILHFFNSIGSKPTSLFGSVSGLLAENYIPYVSINTGYKSNYGITTTGALSAAATTITGLFTASAGALFSSTGTQVNRINFGTCYVQASATTIAASSTVTVDCQASTSGANTALTGITAGDVVNVQFATTTPTTYAGLQILGASASSTTGFITMKVENNTGATYTWTSAASTTNYIVIH